VKVLRAKQEAGKLESVEIPGKHCYTYRLRDRAPLFATAADVEAGMTIEEVRRGGVRRRG